jgi:hypothetical protein
VAITYFQRLLALKRKVPKKRLFLVATLQPQKIRLFSLAAKAVKNKGSKAAENKLFLAVFLDCRK